MRSLSLGVFLALASALGAQTNLIGLGYDTVGVLPPALLQQKTCNPGARICPTVFVPALAVPWAGGAAYDPRARTLWATDGALMTEQMVPGCAFVCRSPAMLTLGPAAVASGLEICPSLAQMFQIETVPGAVALHIWNIATCPITPMFTCPMPLPTIAHVAGGVAIDDANGWIFYATSVFGGGGPANMILVAALNNPCQIVCRIPVQNCGGAVLGPIRALAFDECGQALIMSDGLQTLTMRRTGVAPCAFAAVQCCPMSPGVATYGWVGFDIEPLHPINIGVSCLGPNCAPCPNMRLDAAGDPAIGNGAFALNLSGAPVGSVFALAVSGGPCVAPGLPIFCGQWHLQLATTVFLPMVPVAGLGPCQGAASAPLPIPKNYSLCGVNLCFQGVVICLSAIGPGFGLTNAVDAILN